MQCIKLLSPWLPHQGLCLQIESKNKPFLLSCFCLVLVTTKRNVTNTGLGFFLSLHLGIHFWKGWDRVNMSFQNWKGALQDPSWVVSLFQLFINLYNLLVCNIAVSVQNLLEVSTHCKSMQSMTVLHSPCLTASLALPSTQPAFCFSVQPFPTDWKSLLPETSLDSCPTF